MPSVIARIHSLDGAGVREHRNKYGPGITPVYDQSGQVLEIRFSELSEPDARNWLEDHGYHGFTLEGDDTHPQEHTGKRYLAVELSTDSDIQEIDGGLLVPGVTLLAPGVWTDSTQKTPCRYTAETLERFHANWEDNSYWSRHGGGVPRDITDRIAEIRNLRYDEGVKADLFYHGETSKGKDAIAIVKAAAAGKVPWPFSSVEMMTRDRWIVSEKLYEAQEITFFGAAMVNQGACRVCRLRNNEWVQEDPRKELGSVPGNPTGAEIGEDAAGCKLTKSAFGEMSFSDIRKRFAYDGNESSGEEFSKLSLPHHSVDGTVRPNCVRAALQAIGGARQGTPMDLGGKEAAVKAHLQAHMNTINKKKEQQAAAGSMEEAQNVLQNAITEKLGKSDGEGTQKYGAWILATFPDRCVIRAPDDKTYEVPYTINEDGSVVLGEPVEVEITYQPKEQEMAPDIKELEAENARLKKELEDQKANGQKVEIPKELTESITGLTSIVKDIDARLKKLEDKPEDPRTGDPTAQHELETPSGPRWEVKNGEVVRE